MVREPTHAPHEEPRYRLAELLARIAQLRGSPIKVPRRDRNPVDRSRLRETRRHASRSDAVPASVTGPRERSPSIWRSGSTPGRTWCWRWTARRTYAGTGWSCTRSGGFRSCGWRCRTPMRRAGPRDCAPGCGSTCWRTGRYVRFSEASRAFPGWRAAEIHRGLNEPVPLGGDLRRSLSRVGRALGEREGTGPEDDPLLRQQRAEGTRRRPRHDDWGVTPPARASLSRRTSPRVSRRVTA